MTNGPAAAPPPTRLGNFDIAAMAVTFFALGVTLQVLLIDVGTPSGRALVASAAINSATSQFAYLAVRDAGGGDVAAIAAGAIVATRFGILAMSLAPRLPHGLARRAAAAVFSFDPNVAVAIQQPEPRTVEREFWRVTVAMFIGWFAGIGAGTFLGNIVGDTARFGLDAVFPAALLAIIGSLLRRRDGMVTGIAAAAICVALIPVAPAGLPIILSVVAVAIAVATVREST